MGLSSSKTTSSNKPIYGSHLTGAAGAIKGVYEQQAPKVAGYADQVGALLPSLLERYTAGDPAVNAARGYVTDTLGGDPASNPHLDDMLALSADRVRNRTQAAMGVRGQMGGSQYADVVSRNLAQNETGMRYQDYSQEMARRERAAGMAPGVAAADLMTLAPAFGAAEMASELPMRAAGTYAAGVGGLLGQYTNQTQKSNPGLMGVIGTGLQAASLFSDRRLKTDIRRVGQTDEGVPVYTYRYKAGGPVQMGVMADEVPQEARGPDVDGYATVDYGKVR